MAKAPHTTAEREQAAHFIIYDRRTGEILGAHHLLALPGVRVPSEALIMRKLLACAATALERRPADLRLLSVADAVTLAPGMSVDIDRQVLRFAEQRGTDVRRDAP